MICSRHLRKRLVPALIILLGMSCLDAALARESSDSPY